MRKLLYIIIAMLTLTSCKDYFYDDYTKDFEYTAVYFPHQTLERTFVYGEFDHIQLAVQMGGRRENTSSEWVSYEIDNTIQADSTLTLLPESYYTLSNDQQFEILPGDLGGEISLTVTEDFFNTADTINYYIPFSLTATSLDTILEAKTTMILTLKVEAAKFGHYYHNGVLRIDSVSGADSVIRYHQEEPVTNAVNNWELTTLTHDTLISNGIADQKSAGTNYSFKLSVNEDNTVGILANNASLWQVAPNSVSSYEPERREFYLNYKYQDADGNSYTVSDTLIFRNRVLDGLNQWQ
ncbi:MAG: DUF1735 domain-containing protein [Bacteroidetes bacterium]|nr:DUF1735 domain-containing protein [Bacteroidota bacterium]